MKKKKKCRMVTKAGGPCSRDAASGGMGFCRQHVPIADDKERSKWKARIEVVGLGVSAASVLIKLVELAIQHLHVFRSGPGGGVDEQTQAYRKIKKDFPPFYVNSPTSFKSGAVIVDWKQLLSIYHSAKELQTVGGNGDGQAVEELERQFDKWFASLDSYLQEQLLDAIEKKSQESNRDERA